ncbi:MAG: hypothetical protein KDA24_24515 [Deltaproteobacteria bacterium]|nr:hypothetical protein [Deltaproteobacteria bacterium]
MIRRVLFVTAFLAALAILPAYGEEPDPTSVFRWQATVTPEGPGLARLPLDEGVLTRSGADLADLRLFDAQGNEIPYAIDDGPQLTALRTHSVEIDDLSRDREVDTKRWAPWLYLESFSIETPPDGAEHSWTLEVDSSNRRFVREIEVRVGKPGTNGKLLAKGTIFRLREPGRERLTIQLPPLPKGHISIQLRGAESGYLEPSITLRSTWALGATPEARIPLTVLSSESKDGTTSIVVERPEAIVPRSLRIATANSTFERASTVWDEGQGRRDGRLGRGTLWRLDGERKVQKLDVRMAPAVGERLRLEIDDRDSPPLAIDEVIAVLARPTLVFDAPAGPVIMRFGAERVRRPRYDIVGLLGAGKWVQGEADAPSLFDPRDLQAATLGEVTESPAFSAEPQLAFASRPGKVVDISLWSHLRPLAVPSTGDHLVQLRLAPEDLGTARPDLGDVRIVDSQGQQWPYLRDDTKDATVAISLTLGLRETSQEGATRYPLRLPTGPADVVRVEVQGPAGYFDRAFELRDAEGKRITRGRLVREAGDPRPVAIPLRSVRAEKLVLVITDGDDAALELTDFIAHAATTDILAALQPGNYDLLVGNPESQPPSYELARVRATVMTVRPEPVTPGALTPNPNKRQVDLRGSGAEKVAVWVAILVAVLLLGWITLKSARGPVEGEAATSGGTGASTGAAGPASPSASSPSSSGSDPSV